MAAGARHRFEFRLHVDHAEAGDAVASQATIQTNIIAPVAEIEQQVNSPVELVRAELEVVADDQLRGHPQHAIDREIAQNAARHIANPGDARRDRVDRQHHRLFGQMPATGGVEVLETRIVKGKARCAQAVVEGRRREATVEDGAQFDRTPGHIGEQRRWPQQDRVEPHIAIGAFRQVERAIASQAERDRTERQCALELPVDERCATIHQHARGGQPFELAMHQRGRRQDTRKRIGPGAVGQREIDQPRRADIGNRLALPRLPASLTRNIQRDRARDTHQLGEHARGAAARPSRNLQPVAIGLGVEMDAQPVTPRHHRRQIDQSAPIMDVRARAQPPDPLHPGHRASDDQPVHRQCADADIEPRQDRPLGLGRARLGQLGQRRARNAQAGDVEPIVEPAQRRPMQFGARCGKRQPLGVAHPHIDQRRATVDRALDPTDAVAQSIGGPQTGDGIGNHPVPDRGIDQPQRRKQHQQQTERCPQHDPPPAPAARRHRRGFDRFGKRLPGQNACPSET